jgi:hypothetical protein
VAPNCENVGPGVCRGQLDSTRLLLHLTGGDGIIPGKT